MSLVDLVERDGDCPSNQSFYQCSENGFQGCCAADPCTTGCPSEGEASSASNSNSPILTGVITLTPQPVTSLSPDSSSSPSSSPSSTAALASPTRTISPAAYAVIASSSIAPALPTATPSSSNEVSHVPIIVGVTCAVVGVSIISVLAWFFWRRRQQKRVRLASTSTYGGKEGKERNDSYYEGQHLTEDGYGGYNPNGSLEPRMQSPPPMALAPSTAKTAPAPKGHKKSASRASLTRGQPDYQSLPSQVSPEGSSFAMPTPVLPRTPGSPPTPVHSSHQRQHPAYHLHQLSRHPAFRPGASPPRSQPPLWRHPAFLPETEPSQLDSTPIVPQNELDSIPLDPHRLQGVSSSSALSGSRDLTGEISPPFVSPSQSEPDMLSRFAGNQNQKPRNNRESISRDNSGKTGTSTYSIPIGLGFEGSKGPKGPFNLPLQNNISPPLDSPTVPMRPNMNARDDHVLSWSAYGAGNLSGIGPSDSTGSERSRRQREIEQGHLGKQDPARNSDLEIEREIERWSEGMGFPMGAQGVWADTPDTPLSAEYRESWVERESWARR